MHERYIDAMRKFEGYAPKAKWDHAQFTVGYGTRARDASEVIDKAQAEQRFREEIEKARSIVERFAPSLDQGTKAALTSLTFNAGTRWLHCGLGDAIRNGDLAAAKAIFLQYDKAEGTTLKGLVARRQVEAEWFGQSCPQEWTTAHVPQNGAVECELRSCARSPEDNGTSVTTGRPASENRARSLDPALAADQSSTFNSYGNDRPDEIDWVSAGPTVNLEFLGKFIDWLLGGTVLASTTLHTAHDASKDPTG